MFDLMPFDRRGHDMFRYLDQMEENFWNGLGGSYRCHTDIIDNGTSYELRAELPGFSKEEIRIDLQGDRLTLSAEHGKEEQTEEKTYIHRERSFGAVSRSFDITGIQADQIQAAYENGVLRLTLPKKKASPTVSRKIEIH